MSFDEIFLQVSERQSTDDIAELRVLQQSRPSKAVCKDFEVSNTRRLMSLACLGWVCMMRAGQNRLRILFWLKGELPVMGKGRGLGKGWGKRDGELLASVPADKAKNRSIAQLLQLPLASAVSLPRNFNITLLYGRTWFASQGSVTSLTLFRAGGTMCPPPPPPR